MQTRTGFVYDELMTRHVNKTDPSHLEGPIRVTAPYKTLRETGLLDQCRIIKSRLASNEELSLVHSAEYISRVKGWKTEEENPCQIPETWPTYISPAVYQAAACAVGCVLNMVDAVCTQEIDNGLALVRPPGHHAEVESACGCCFFNTLAIAAYHALRTHGLQRILILDWDVHHGNGIQHIFYGNPQVLYISIHRYEDGNFFPHLKECDFDATGCEKGEGYTVNIPWSRAGMGDAEYRAAFDRVVMPIAGRYQPELVLVAAGFDAAEGDPMGENTVSPHMFGYMTEQLSTLAGGRVILSLEGGYNIQALEESLVKCMEALQGKCVVKDLAVGDPSAEARRVIDKVIQTQMKYWDNLK